MAVFWVTQSGRFSKLFWTMVFCNFIFPVPILAIKNLRNKIGWTVVASIPIIVGMWLERFLIIVPSLSHKYLPYNYGTYRPSWVEITITVGTFAGMGLLYLLFSRVFPIISIWELKLGGQRKPETAPALASPEVAAEQP
jgi:Ni/Fe-hydrogenase subunit HybB-like protein